MKITKKREAHMPWKAHMVVSYLKNLTNNIITKRIRLVKAQNKKLVMIVLVGML